MKEHVSHLAQMVIMETLIPVHVNYVMKTVKPVSGFLVHNVTLVSLDGSTIIMNVLTHAQRNSMVKIKYVMPVTPTVNIVMDHLMDNVLLVLITSILILMEVLVLKNAKTDIMQMMNQRNVKHVMIHVVLAVEEAVQNVPLVVMITINLEPNVLQLVQQEHGQTQLPIYVNLVTILVKLVLVEKTVVVLLVTTHFI